MQIDARGKGRPVPVMMTEEAVSRVTEGIVEVVVDNEESIRIEYDIFTSYSILIDWQRHKEHSENYAGR